MKKSLTSILLISMLACGSDDRVDDPIPFQKFPDININVSLPQYSALRPEGGFMHINGGIRGIILYKKSASEYYAFEQNCSFQPNDACATIEPFALYMQDACCGSVFNYEGNPTGGLAWRPLGQYETSVSGSTLTITDNVINY